MPAAAPALAPAADRADGLRRAVNGRSGRGGRLVSQRAGAATHARAAVAGRFLQVLAAHRGGRVALVGRIEFGGRFALREVDVGIDLCLDVAGAHDRFHDRQDALRQVLLGAAHVLQLLLVEACPVVVGHFGQQRPGLIEHAHGLDLQIRYAGGDQVHDAGDLRAVQAAAVVQGQQHRSGRLLLLAHEGRLVRQREMHPRRLHGGQRHDRAGQFPFEPALEVQPLLELRGAELLVLHQLETHGAALGQALRGQLQARVVHEVGRHEDGSPALRELVPHVQLGQRGDHGAAVLVAEAGVEDAPFRLAPRQQPVGQQGGKHQRRGDERQLAALGQGQEALQRRVGRHIGGIGGNGSDAGVHGGGRDSTPALLEQRAKT